MYPSLSFNNYQHMVNLFLVILPHLPSVLHYMILELVSNIKSFYPQIFQYISEKSVLCYLTSHSATVMPKQLRIAA